MYTVLYVDDEQALLDLGKIFLEQSGSITVETALSATEGILALKKNAIDCIISDYQMPEMNGLAFLKLLRKENNQIPFILFTGRGREEVVIDAVNNGVDYYLQKGGDPTSQFVELEHKIKLAIERRRTDSELKESRQRMTDIIDHLPDATFAIDLDGKVIVWNRAMEEMTGVNKEQILGTGDHSYALPFYGTRRPILLDLVLREETETLEKYPRITRKDRKLISDIYIPLLYGGKGAHLWFIASPLYDTHGNITGAIESIRDITDRKTTEIELRAAYEQLTASEEELRDQYDDLKKGEDALRESEENYRNILEDIQDAYYRSDTAGNLILASPSAVHLLGYESASELIGKNIAQTLYYDPEERARLLAELTSRGTVTDYEVTLKKQDGTPVHVSTSSHKYFDENGIFRGVEGIFRDITERKKAKEDLMESENRYRTIFENTGTAIVLIEENTIIAIANAEYERLSGYTRDELEGKKSWTEFVVKEDLERMLAQHRMRREKHEAALRHYEFRFITKTGEIRNIFLTIDIIPGTKKSVASLMDITAHVRSQESLKLANRKLNLLSGITRHDIGNQLQALSEYLELSRESLADPARTSEFTDKEMHITDTIASLINFTRDYEELGMNAPLWQNIPAIIGNIVTLLPVQDIRIDAGDPALEVFADPLLERVFYNLIDNALRYGGDRMTAVRVSSHVRGNGLVIVFEDNGAGIAIRDKNHLFEKGFGKNTGLGLFLSREILGITGITITENGEPQKGARFVITVPEGAYRCAGTT